MVLKGKLQELLDKAAARNVTATPANLTVDDYFPGMITESSSQGSPG